MACKSDPSLVVTPREGRQGEKMYKTFNIDNPGEHIREGFLYPEFPRGGPPMPAIIGRLPDGSAIGILPFDKEVSEPGLLSRRLPKLAHAGLFTPEECEAFDSRPFSNAAGGFVCNQLYAGDCVVMVGDAAVSPPPAGQGVNHALEAAAVLLKELQDVKARGVAACIKAYDQARREDEQAYAFFGAEKSMLQRAACGLGFLVGLHSMRAGKDTTRPYSELTCMHKYV